MFFTDAFAESAASTTTATAPANDPAMPVTEPPSAAMSFLPFLFIVVVFYFLLIRPQQKKLREHDSMVKALRRGDKVVTAGGVIGVIHKIEAEDIIVLEVAPEVRLRVVKDTITTVMTKSIANDNQADDKKEAKK